MVVTVEIFFNPCTIVEFLPLRGLMDCKVAGPGEALLGSGTVLERGTAVPTEIFETVEPVMGNRVTSPVRGI